DDGMGRGPHHRAEPVSRHSTDLVVDGQAAQDHAGRSPPGARIEEKGRDGDRRGGRLHPSNLSVSWTRAASMKATDVPWRRRPRGMHPAWRGQQPGTRRPYTMTKSLVLYCAGVRFLSRTTAGYDRCSAPDRGRTEARPRAGVSQDTVSRDTVSQAVRVRGPWRACIGGAETRGPLRPDAGRSAITMSGMGGLGWRTRVLLVSSLVTLAAVLAGWVIFTLCAARLIESIYRGESWAVLNNLIRDRAHTPLEYYFESGRVQFSRLILLAVCMQAIVVAVLLRRETRQTVVDFFTAKSSPINLAVLRIVFFTVLFQFVDVRHVVWFSQIPPELRFPPVGVGWLLPYVPINPSAVTLTAVMLRVCCLSALVGLFSRTSAGLAALLSLYVLGVPELYGKVNHYHYLVAFAALLAASPCGDALSCDAVRAAWRRADRAQTALPAPSMAYALPLRFVWLLVGLIYFFPGFWKLWSSGFDWAFSDNLSLQMHAKWLEYGDWTPFFRLDHHPLLSQAAAFLTIVFEISFVFLIFFPRVRLLAPLGGFLFHTLTYVFMVIFFNVTAVYVAFVDWSALSMRLGRWLFPEPLSLVYDGQCRTCRRIIATLRTFDVFGRVSYVDGRDPD